MKIQNESTLSYSIQSFLAFLLIKKLQFLSHFLCFGNHMWNYRYGVMLSCSKTLSLYIAQEYKTIEKSSFNENADVIEVDFNIQPHVLFS